MGMAATLAIWLFEQTFVLLSKVVITWNLSLTGPKVPEEKMFKYVDDHKIWLILE